MKSQKKVWQYFGESYHFKAGQREISESSRIKHLIVSPQVLDVDGIVQDDGLSVLDVAKGWHVEHHPAHVIRIAANLDIIFISSAQVKIVSFYFL